MAYVMAYLMQELQLLHLFHLLQLPQQRCWCHAHVRVGASLSAQLLQQLQQLW
jgi:hypothetical protein